MTSVRKETFVSRNKSFTYLLPLIGEKGSQYTNVSGCFYGDKDHPEHEGKILLLYRLHKDWSDNLVDWVESNPFFVEKYHVDWRYWMFVFDIPEGMEWNYECFINGKYSFMDDDYKRHILSFHGDVNTMDITAVRNVLYRAEEAYERLEEMLDVVIPREQEVSSVPDDQFELFSKERLWVQL